MQEAMYYQKRENGVTACELVPGAVSLNGQ
jgi:hypothetical protein